MRSGLVLLAAIAAHFGHCADGTAGKASPLPFVSPIFGDNMVLQRGKPNRFWVWAELREVQAMVAATVPNFGLAVTIDTGEADNIHPKEKKVVGERLAYCALAECFHIDVPYLGPTFASLEPVPGGLKLHFTNVGSGLTVHGDKLAEFSVAGTDRKWTWADARIDGDSVVVSSPSVSYPAAARYAWQGNPAATLFSDVGLPAVPFRTDSWPFTDED
jgi:sialate O-acetylesterase